MDIKTWYGDKIEIPDFTSQHKNAFLSNNVGLLRTLLPKREVKFKIVSVGNGQVETAAVWMGDSVPVVYLNERIISRDPEDRINPDASPELAFSAAMGSMVHEYAHILYNTELKPVFVESMADIMANKMGKINKRLAGDIFNILEDIRIERKVKKDVPALSWTLDKSNEYYFSESNRRIAGELETIGEAPKDNEEVVVCMNYLLGYKTGQLPRLAESECAKFLHDRAEEFVLVESTDEKLDVCINLYKFLVQGIESQESEDQENEGQEGEGQEGGNQEGEGESDLDGYKEVSEEFKPVDGEVSARFQLERADSTEISQYLNRISISDGIPVKVYDTPLSGSEIDLKFSEDFKSLARLARKRATKNKTVGPARDNGGRPRKSKLYRVATDGRVFAKKQRSQTFQKPEVVILTDFSFSMVSSRINGPRSQTCFEGAFAASIQAMEALRQGRIKGLFLGHTTDELESSIVFRLGTEKTSRSDFLKRCQFLNFNRTVLLNSNADSAALLEAGKMFTGTGKKILIVVSDGKPASYYYRTPLDGIERTKESVNKLRKEGINVLSMSIKKNALEPNNEIYGEENNVLVSSPEELVNIIKNIV